MGRSILVRLWLGKGLHKGRKVALIIPELGLLRECHGTVKCRFRTVVIRTAVALFSHRCRIALLAFALLTFALFILSLRTVDPFALLAFALLASHWCRSHFCLSHSCRTSGRSFVRYYRKRGSAAYIIGSAEALPILCVRYFR